MSGTPDQRLEGGGLCVLFRARDDRIAHEVRVRGDTGWLHLLSSIEGVPADDWPASPPFQSLSLEPRPAGRQAALLVGMAGKSHWSASIELDPPAGRLTFDIACRIRVTPGPLASSYQVLRPACEATERSALFSSSDALPARVELALCEQVGAARLVNSGDALKIVPTIIRPETASQTVRWGYTIVRVALESAGQRG